MIITKQKDKEKLKKCLDKYDKFFLVGCSECASLCGTGGEDALKKMEEELKAEGKTVTGTFVPKTACQTLGTKSEIKKEKDKINDASVIVAMSCGAGAQTAVELFPEKPVVPSNDSLFLGNMTRYQMFDERCSMCGDCVIDKTGGICPVTNCPKGLLNGPCGGMQDGKCEVSAEIDCAWVRIYERQTKIGETKEMEEVIEAKDWSKNQSPHAYLAKETKDKAKK